MTGPNALSPRQVVNQLIVKARRVAAEHDARVGTGSCPICRRTADCDARSVALAFLAEHDQVTGNPGAVHTGPVQWPPPPPDMCLSCASAHLGGMPHDYCEREVRWYGQRLPCRCPEC